jgi:putative transposase
LKLGFDVSERSVARYLRRVPRRGDPASRWSAFLANHREAIVAGDFFTVPTLTFQRLSCFFIIEHRRRTILHFNVTREPTPRLGGATTARRFSWRWSASLHAA